MTIFYFTSTGNCLAVAKSIIATESDGTLISIPQVIDSPLLEYSDDTIGIVFPIYDWGLPRMVKRFCESAKLKAVYIFAIGTYGNLPGACMLNMQKLAMQNNYKIDYAQSLLMVDNYLPAFDINREAEKLTKKDTEGHLAQIIVDISARKTLEAKSSLVWRTATTIIQAGSGHTQGNTAARRFMINDMCTKCGTCAKVCPSGNIKVTDRVAFADKCEGCLGCVHLCPQNAIHLKNERSGARWRHPDVSLAEIVRANNREGYNAISRG